MRDVVLGGPLGDHYARRKRTIGDDGSRYRTDAPRAAAARGPIIATLLGEVHRDLRAVGEGAVATYIPELSRAQPDWFGISIATVDGQVYDVGDAAQPFTIQSVSKPFLYGYALREYGQEFVLRRVGVEPTGEAFNSIVLDKVNNRPFNPMVNSGAIAMAALMKGATRPSGGTNMLDLLGQFAGRRMEIDRRSMSPRTRPGTGTAPSPT